MIDQRQIQKGCSKVRISSAGTQSRIQSRYRKVTPRYDYYYCTDSCKTGSRADRIRRVTIRTVDQYALIKISLENKSVKLKNTEEWKTLNLKLNNEIKESQVKFAEVKILNTKAESRTKIRIRIHMWWVRIRIVWRKLYKFESGSYWISTDPYFMKKKGN